MSYDLLIHEYLDTGLDDARQEALFAEIARNPEVRNEFNSQLKLQNIARMDLNSISPPADITSNIFQKLEFSVPSNAEKVGFWNRTNTAIISVLLGLALGVGLFYSVGLQDREMEGSAIGLVQREDNVSANLAYNGKSGDKNAPKQEIERSGNNSISEPKESNNFRIDQNSQNSLSNIKKDQYRNNSTSSNRIQNNSNSGLGSKNKKTLQDYLNSRTYKPNFINAEDSRKNSESIVSKFENISQNGISLSYLDGYSRMDENNSQLITNNDTPQLNGKNKLLSSSEVLNKNNYSSTNPLNIGPDNTKWAIGVRQINQINIEPNVNNENSAFLNRSLFINYKLSPNISLVAELGSEKFVQEFEQSIAGTDVQTTQNPILAWYGIGAKFRADEIFGQHFVTPYIQTLFAANSIGPILRPTLGLDFRLNEYFTVTTSYDRPILFYSVLGENLNSSKHGFTVGFNLNF